MVRNSWQDSMKRKYIIPDYRVISFCPDQLCQTLGVVSNKEAIDSQDSRWNGVEWDDDEDMTNSIFDTEW